MAFLKYIDHNNRFVFFQVLFLQLTLSMEDFLWTRVILDEESQTVCQPNTGLQETTVTMCGPPHTCSSHLKLNRVNNPDQFNFFIYMWHQITTTVTLKRLCGKVKIL